MFIKPFIAFYYLCDHPPLPPVSYMKVVCGAKKVGGRCCKGFFTTWEPTVYHVNLIHL